MVKQQERRAKKAKVAKAKVDKVVGDTIAKVKRGSKRQAEAYVTTISPEANDLLKWRGEMATGCTEADYVVGCRVRRLRDAGLSWLAIGAQLGMKEGKAGAGQARRAYAAAFGSYPRSMGVTEEGTRVKVAGARRKTKVEKREDRASGLVKASRFSDIDDEPTILEAVRGNTIEWTIVVPAVGNLPEIVNEQTAKVHDGKGTRIIEGPKGRILNFFQVDAEDQQATSGMRMLGRGPLRSVYVHTIHTVR